MSSDIEQDINRILVALDPCQLNPRILERALILAERMRAELVALFVEDEDLLHLAGLPFAREVHRSSAAERKLDVTQMSRTLQHQAEGLRQLIKRSVGQRNIRASVRVVQGRFMPAALAAALDTDVAFLTIADQSNTLLPSTRTHNAAPTRLKPIWTIFNGSPESLRALALAIELSASEVVDLMLVLPGVNPVHASELQQQATELIVSSQAKAKIQTVLVPENELNQLSSLIRRQGCSLLVLHRDNPLMANVDNLRAVESLGCPIVLIR